MRSRWVARALAGLLLNTLLLTACGAGSEERDPPDEHAEEDDLSGETLPEVADEARSAEEIFAEIAEMDLTYEERLDYLYEQALAEGAVLQYGSSNLELQEAWSEGFQEDYPEINHLYVRQRLDDLYERILAEARSGRHLVDVIETTTVSGAALDIAGVIADHHGVPVPEGYPDQFVESSSVVASLNPQVITWNTNAVADGDAPRDWDDFLEPEHAGCVLDAGSQSFVAAMINERGYDATEAWLQGFLENDGIVQRGLSATTRAIAAGEFDCAVYLNLHGVEALIEDGAPLGWHAPDPTPASASSIFIYKHTERPHTAALLMHWILDTGGAQVVADDGRIAVHPSVTSPNERLRAWTTPGTELEQRLRPLLTATARETEEQVLHLLETYLVPRLVRD